MIKEPIGFEEAAKIFCGVVSGKSTADPAVTANLRTLWDDLRQHHTAYLIDQNLPPAVIKFHSAAPGEVYIFGPFFDVLKKFATDELG